MNFAFTSAPANYPGGVTTVQELEAFGTYIKDCGINLSSIPELATAAPKILMLGALAAACIASADAINAPGLDQLGVTDKAKAYLTLLNGIQVTRTKAGKPAMALGAYLYVAQTNSKAGTKDWKPDPEPLGDPTS